MVLGSFKPNTISHFINGKKVSLVKKLTKKIDFLSLKWLKPCDSSHTYFTYGRRANNFRLANWAYQENSQWAGPVFEPWRPCSHLGCWLWACLLSGTTQLAASVQPGWWRNCVSASANGIGGSRWRTPTIRDTTDIRKCEGVAEKARDLNLFKLTRPNALKQALIKSSSQFERQMPSEDDDTSMARRSWACKAITQRCLQTAHSIFMNQVNDLRGVTA